MPYHSPMNNNSTVSLKLRHEDIECAIDALCQAGYSLLHDAKRSCDNGDLHYASVLFNEAANYLSVADEMRFSLTD